MKWKIRSCMTCMFLYAFSLQACSDENGPKMSKSHPFFDGLAFPYTLISVTISDQQMYVLTFDSPESQAIHSFSLEDPLQPRYQDSIRAVPGGRFLVSHGDTLVLWSGDSGIRVFDVQNPKKMRLCQSFYENGHELYGLVLTDESLVLIDGEAVETFDLARLKTGQVQVAKRYQHTDTLRSITAKDNVLYIETESKKVLVLSVDESTTIQHVDTLTSEKNIDAIEVNDDRLYVLTLRNIQTYDINNPTEPSLLSIHDSPHGPWFSKVQANYILGFLPSKTVLFSLENPDVPVVVDEYPNQHYDGAIAFGYFYNMIGNKLRITSVSQPRFPYYSLPAVTSSDAQVYNDHVYTSKEGVLSAYVLLEPNQLVPVHDISICEAQPACSGSVRLAGMAGDLAFVYLYDSHSLAAYDIQNPEQPIYMDSLAEMESSFQRQIGEHLLVSTSLVSRDINIIDFRDPTNLQITANLELPDGFANHNHLLDGDLLYVSGFDDLLVLDLADPSNPTQLYMWRYADEFDTSQMYFNKLNKAVYASWATKDEKTHSTVHIAPLSDLPNPQAILSLALDFPAWISGIFHDQKTLVIADSRGLLFIYRIDLENQPKPDEVRLIGQYDLLEPTFGSSGVVPFGTNFLIPYHFAANVPGELSLLDPVGTNQPVVLSEIPGQSRGERHFQVQWRDLFTDADEIIKCNASRGSCRILDVSQENNTALVIWDFGNKSSNSPNDQLEVFVGNAHYFETASSGS